VTQRVKERLLRSLKPARIAGQRPDKLDAFRDQLHRRLELPVEPILPRSGGQKLLVEPILPRSGGQELLVEPILPRVGAILPSGDRFENRLDSLESRPDFRFHEAQYTGACLRFPRRGARGHAIHDGRGLMGGYKGVRIDRRTGIIDGGSDPRKDGLAIGR
jgi:hypothetical protein